MRVIRAHQVVRRTQPRRFICLKVETPAKLADDAAGIFAGYGSIRRENREVPRPRVPQAAARARPRWATRASLHAYFAKLSDHSFRRITDTLKQTGMIPAGAIVTFNSIE